MTIKTQIISLMEREDYIPMTMETIGDVFGIYKQDRKKFYKVLKDLEREGIVTRNFEDKYIFLENEDFVLKGVFQGHEKGFGFVILEDKEKEDIFIPRDYTNGAMDGDLVIANIVKESSNTRRQEGEIVRIVERKNRQVVGTFEDSSNFGFVIPDNGKIPYDIFIPKGKVNKAKNHQKVVVEIDKWPEQGKNPEGKIVEVLGYLSDKGTDILSVIRQFELPEDFPSEVQTFANRLETEVSKEDIKARVDYRNIKTVTIDGADAKDLDDAISIERLEHGFRLGVHIADVSHYVVENTEIDLEAYGRGNSVYLIDRVVPMLPKELSNGICSLNQGVDRLCLSVIMDIDKSGNVVDHKILETVINSDARLVYDHVSDYLELGTEESKEILKDFTEELDNMKELSDILRSKRDRRGSIDFDFPETRIVLDENGFPIDIVREERRIGNKIIEEFMLVCNETVGEQFYWAEIPFLYRIHEEPLEEKIANFNRVIHNFGYKIKGKQGIHPKDLQMLTKEIKGKEEERLISTLLLRSLRKAVYSAEPDIHFGLATEYYSHFTAPIRRYPDLVIHRIIKDYINGKLSGRKLKHLEGILPEVADHTSFTERRAEEAEREVEDMKKAQYMVQYIGDVFEGTVSSLTNFGIFVELENTIEGLIRYQDMQDDYYAFDEDNYIVIGERTKRVYKLGEKVKIRVTNSDVAKRNIDFEFVDELEEEFYQ